MTHRRSNRHRHRHMHRHRCKHRLKHRHRHRHPHSHANTHTQEGVAGGGGIIPELCEFDFCLGAAQPLMSPTGPNFVWLNDKTVGCNMADFFSL